MVKESEAVFVHETCDNCGRIISLKIKKSYKGYCSNCYQEEHNL
jgi:hypothetical protein